MKKLFLGVAITSALGLTACSEDSYNELVEKTEPLVPQSVLVFDPANGELPLPSDLLFSGTLDGTLNIPGEESGDYTDPQLALGALDGWSTSSPISIEVAPSTDNDGTVLTIDAASVAQPGAVRMFEATVGGALSSDPECSAAASVSACKVGEELTFGVDFVSTVSGNSIAIIPLKPLKAAQSYIYATTTLIQDSAGNPIAPSSSYQTLKLDIDTKPLETPDQLTLQTLVNSYEKGMAAAAGVDADTVTYSALFTTQSVTDVYETTKLLMVDQTEGNPYAPALTAMPSSAGYTVATRLGMTAADGVAYVLADLADVYTAQLKVPIYGDCSSAGCLDADFNPTINGSWKAYGDSPVSVLLALSSGTLSQTNYGMQAVAYGIDPSEGIANPALLAGKAWYLDDGETPTDPTKHLTKFNPIPAIKGYETVSVQITLPNAAKLAALQGDAFVAPTDGWPATIAMHGLGGSKEMALTYAGTYAAAGIATIAIDMPLHGTRSFDATGDGVYEVSATDPYFASAIGLGDGFVNGNPLVFVNIGSTLTVRDNFRQATVDHLALRAALSGLYYGLTGAGQSAIFDNNKISVQGLSLGGIVGTTFSNYASTGLVNPATGDVLPNVYGVNAASLIAPAGGLAGSFAGSASFGPILFQTVTASDTFQELVDAANTSGYEAGSDEYAALVQAVYAEFIPTFAFAVQTAIDSADPINHASLLADTQLPVHLIEVVGDDTNMPDQVLPNSVASFPLSGTEPFIANLGLACVSTTTAGSGVVRFSKGHHSSIASPSEVAGVTDGKAASATAEMQTQVAAFAATAGQGAATIVVTDASVIQSCPE
ncbi:VolA/Pla-1 family phospholipase [Shewanella youngdeokensis]|uniref:Lipase n=1 Tax=Shewanella youngdeokensis TaxID=2999068 RepID=A0ABZ0JUT5_9GAMM|nr:lipase [Shewanella sp. DAU334]